MNSNELQGAVHILVTLIICHIFNYNENRNRSSQNEIPFEYHQNLEEDELTAENSDGYINSDEFCAPFSLDRDDNSMIDKFIE